MSDRYQLVDVENSDLLTSVSRLVRQGNKITAEVLAHLAEIEDRMLHLELGFPSLFAYCVEALGMSDGAAGRRVAAARVCRRFAEAFALVASGELHLSAVCAVAPCLESSNATELFGACRGKTRRQVEELLADRFPKADVREQVRRMTSQQIEPLGGERFGVHFTADSELRELMERARAIASHRLPGGGLAGLMKIVFAQFVKNEEARRFAISRKPRRIATKKSGAISAKQAGGDEVAAKQVPGADPVTARQDYGTDEATKQARRPNELAVTADEATKQARDAYEPVLARSLSADDAIAQPASDAHGLMAATDRGAIAISTKRSHGANNIPAKLAAPAMKNRTPPGGVRRWVRAAVRREVYARDEGRCSFVAADGRRCAARARLELDHIEPWAMRGSAESDNLRLRCRAHNALHARHSFGAKHVAAKIAARRAKTCREESRSLRVPSAETCGNR